MPILRVVVGDGMENKRKIISLFWCLKTVIDVSGLLLYNDEIIHYEYVYLPSRCLFSAKYPLLSNRQHLSYDVCLEVRGEIIRTVLCCIVY